MRMLFVSCCVLVWSFFFLFTRQRRTAVVCCFFFFHLGLCRGDSDISVAAQRTRHKEHHSDGNKEDKDVLVLPVRCVLTKEKTIYNGVLCVFRDPQTTKVTNKITISWRCLYVLVSKKENNDDLLRFSACFP